MNAVKTASGYQWFRRLKPTAIEIGRDVKPLSLSLLPYQKISPIVEITTATVISKEVRLRNLRLA